mmetsp:Transcript_7865/g.31866  ORF Transcript_7865/g.31866 Transcript_7865/m.31866 type:complete len:306 (-) Transcript_7865:31-948(-)
MRGRRAPRAPGRAHEGGGRDPREVQEPVHVLHREGDLEEPAGSAARRVGAGARARAVILLILFRRAATTGSDTADSSVAYYDCFDATRARDHHAHIAMKPTMLVLYRRQKSLVIPPLPRSLVEPLEVQIAPEHPEQLLPQPLVQQVSVSVVEPRLSRGVVIVPQGAGHRRGDPDLPVGSLLVDDVRPFPRSHRDRHHAHLVRQVEVVAGVVLAPRLHRVLQVVEHLVRHLVEHHLLLALGLHPAALLDDAGGFRLGGHPVAHAGRGHTFAARERLDRRGRAERYRREPRRARSRETAGAARQARQ